MNDALRVLCIDDEPEVVELTEAYLQRELPGGEVVSATGGTEGLAVLEAEEIHCVVSDYDMPDGNGLELLRAVRERDPELPFILFTGKGSEEVASEAVSAGVTDYLQKAGPEQFQLLANRIENAVGQRRAVRDRDAARRKVEQLHDIALELRQVDDRGAVFERATEAATEVLAFDVCGLFVRDGEQFRPAALENVSTELEPLDRDEGLLGKTFRTGESLLVDDVTEAAGAAPRRECYRACISVPVGDHGVLQAISENPGFFDERDLELAELLVSHVAGALDRITYQADLETTNGQLDTVLANTTANIYIKDREGRYTLVNDAFADSLGLSRGYIVGRTDEDLQELEVAAEIRANDRLAIEEQRPVEVEESAGWDEEERIYYSVKAPLFGDDGEPVGVCGVSSDITELKAHQRELERKTERLEEFASVISHDLRNPLTVAQGYAELLADEDGEAAEELQASLERMEEILEDLLTLTREGRQVGETERVDLAAVAEDAWGTVDTTDATLVTDCGLTVEADASRLAQAFENLFRNAVEHGGPDVTVRLVRTGDGFAVVDDGDGLPDDEDLFHAGVSTKTRGTGVGLTIVDRIAEAHGWQLSAHDGEPGARFEFSV